MGRHAKNNAPKDSYNTSIIRDPENVDVPEWLTCCQCGNRRSKSWFSGSSLKTVRQRIYREGRAVLALNPGGIVRCTECTSDPEQCERICKICGQRKGLDCYAKNQRQYHEPTCIRCQDWMMNDDGEFDSRNRQRALAKWEEHLLAKSTPAEESSQRQILGPGEGPASSSSRPKPQLTRRLLLYHEGLSSGPGAMSKSSTGEPDDNVSKQAPRPRSPKAPYYDDLQSLAPESHASSSLVSSADDFLLDYGSDDDTIVPPSERQRTGWLKIRPNRHRAMDDEY